MEVYRYILVNEEPNIVYIFPDMIENRIEALYYKKQYLDVDKKIKDFDNGSMYLKDICRKITDGTHKTPDYKSQGIKFITAKNVFEYGIDFENVKYISKDEHNEISKRCKAEPGDILFTKVGRIGYAKVIPRNVPNFSIFVSVALLKLKNNVDSGFIEAFLNSKYGRIQSEKLAKGSNQPDFHLEDIAEIKVPIPSPEIQKYIGDKARKAEELREEAKRMKKEAEEIINEVFSFKELELLYKENKAKFQWINTDILNDRIDGNYYEEKYIETINHMKRKSENYVTLNDIIDSIYTGKKPIYDEKGIEAYFVQSGNISSNFLEVDNKVKVDLGKYNQILFGDLLIAKDGETIGRLAINFTRETIIINEHTYCVRLKEKYKHYSAYIYYLLINNYVNSLIRREATGSTQKGLNFSFVENIIIPILKEDIIMDLYDLELKRCNNIYQSKQLIQEAKKDIEDLIEGNFDISKVKSNS